VTIAPEFLPMPGKVELEQLDTVQRSAAWRSGSILRTRAVDQVNRPRRWSLTYEAANGAVAAAIRSHFQQHSLADFAWTPPGASSPLRVMHREPPSIDWDSSTTATVRVYLEELLAFA
jgi:hypothetical protein